MKIILYKTSDENNKVIKTFSAQIELSGTLHSECSILNPIIEDIKPPENISSFNYAFIEDFNRYYFITDISVINNQLWKISLRCDVLMSYAEDIMQLDVNILRNIYDYNLMIEDTKLPTYSDDRIQCFNFPKTLTNKGNFKYYLTLIGGGQ